MIRSMTAFARRESQHDFGTLGCEIRSVNHRYLEPNLRLPEALRELEFSWRERLRQRAHRGKVDVHLKLEATSGETGSLRINHALAEQLLVAVGEIDKMARHSAALNATDILRFPGVIQTSEPEHDAVVQAANALFDATFADFLACREREGTELAAIIESRLQSIGDETVRVRERLPQIQHHYRDRLLNRLKELHAELNMDRLEQELVFLAQKIDVEEELDRLNTHILEFRRVLNEGGAVGRRLDFLLQELNREANTLGAKSVAADTSQSSVELKVLIEQIREQVQNIE